MAPTQTFFDLVNALSSLDVDKFQPFEVITTQYKKLLLAQGAISTDVLIPKTLLESHAPWSCPVLLRVHGGFLVRYTFPIETLSACNLTDRQVTGSSRYAPWFSTWILDYAAKNNAIIVSPNYRLLPEATGEHILEDMNDLWNWLHQGGLSECLREAGHLQVTVDLSRLLLLGESAG